MEYRSLDVTIISADDIKDVNFFSKMSVYVVVSLLSQTKTKKKTHVHKKCGTSPRWNHRMKFAVHEPSLSDPSISFLFQLKCDSLLRNTKDIGEVCVHLQELFNANGENDNIEKVVDYQVRTPSGKPKGIFKFSYKFGEKLSQDSVKNEETAVTAYPHAVTSAPQEGIPAVYPAYPSYGYATPPPPGYPSHHQPGVYPPMGYGGYPGMVHVYPPPPGYGYQPPPPPMGYVYPPPMQQVLPARKQSRMGGGAGLGMGLAGGLLGGMVLGEMASDIGEMAAYNDGFVDGIGDGLGMDGSF